MVLWAILLVKWTLCFFTILLLSVTKLSSMVKHLHIWLSLWNTLAMLKTSFKSNLFSWCSKFCMIWDSPSLPRLLYSFLKLSIMIWTRLLSRRSKSKTPKVIILHLASMTQHKLPLKKAMQMMVTMKMISQIQLILHLARHLMRML